MARERDPDRQIRLFAVGPYGVSGSGRDSDAGSSLVASGGLDPDRWKLVMSNLGILLVSMYLAGPGRGNPEG